MAENATYITEPTRLRGPSNRRRDIDNAILALLKSGPKTISGLFRLLNPDAKRMWVHTARGWKHRFINVTVDMRVLTRHLKYLMRDGLVKVQSQVKVLHRDMGETCWLKKYYSLAAREDSATPSPSPPKLVKKISEIHNPFHGEEGALRYVRWLRDP